MKKWGEGGIIISEKLGKGRLHFQPRLVGEKIYSRLINHIMIMTFEIEQNLSHESALT